jgi:nucleoside-diphosphate-sugar epimerase
MRVLVTGGGGYVGSHVVDELLTAGHSVRVLDALIHGPVPSLLSQWSNPELEFMHADVRDADARAAGLNGADAVVHLAAIVGDPACSRQPDLAHQVNLEGSRALLDEATAAGVRRFLFASTCSNYGKLAEPDAVATEQWELRPVSLYAETKVAAEQLVLDRSANGFSAACLRFATVYGTSPRMRFDLTVNEFARDARLAGKLLVYGEQFWRPYIHVRDAARAIRLVLEAPKELIAGEVFNVGNTGENFRKLDLVAMLKRRLPELDIEFVHKDEDPRDYRVSFDKILGVLGFATTRTVERGIDEVISLLESGLIADPYAGSYRN